MRKSKTAKLALCGVLAALAVALMFLGGAVPFASIACPVLASVVLLPVYAELGYKWGLLWYGAVAALSLLIAPDKEGAILFVALGYYPMLHKLFGRLRGQVLKWLAKLLYLNAATVGAYLLMLYVFCIESVVRDFEGVQAVMLALILLLANISFVVYDLLLDRLEIFYHVRLRPKLKL